jgi:hypothetical protein
VKPGAPWELAGFEDLLERWVNDEQPSIELRVVVADWISPATTIRSQV